MINFIYKLLFRHKKIKRKPLHSAQSLVDILILKVAQDLNLRPWKGFIFLNKKNFRNGN